MIIASPQQLKQLYQINSRLLSIDVGTKTLGMALSDTRWKIASPYKTLPRTKLNKTVQAMQPVIKEFNIIAFVVGLPLHMNGSMGTSVQSVRDFANELAKCLNIDVLFWDERLTTVIAERALLAADMSRQRRKQLIDKVAATVILQGLLDAVHYDRVIPFCEIPHKEINDMEG